MAAHYIECIMRQNPHGPYALAGFSFGGMIAWEMAGQLRQMGREVKLVAMFDTNAYRSIANDPFAMRLRKQTAYYINNIIHALKFTTGFKNTVVEKTKAIKRKLVKRYWMLRHGNDQNHQGFFGYAFKIDKCNIEALKQYQLKPQDVVLDVFKAQTRTYYVADTESLGWKPLALKGLNVHNIPGEHNTIFKAPNDTEFAAVLQKCLDRVNLG